jgi:hypothetical protein
LKLPKGKRMRTEIHDRQSLSQKFKRCIGKTLPQLLCSLRIEAVISGKIVLVIQPLVKRKSQKGERSICLKAKARTQ